MKAAYRRLVVKLSGEQLAGESGFLYFILLCGYISIEHATMGFAGQTSLVRSLTNMG